MVMTTLYARQQKRHRCIEKSSGLGGRRQGEGGMIWENGIKTCIISNKKQIASPVLMQDPCAAGATGLETTLQRATDVESSQSKFMFMVVCICVSHL